MSDFSRRSTYTPKRRPVLESKLDFDDLEMRLGGGAKSVAEPELKHKVPWRPFQAREKPQQPEEKQQHPMTKVREAAMKLKAKKKRDEDKAEKRKKELRGIKSITTFFDYSNSSSAVVDISDEEEEDQLTSAPLIADDDDDNINYSTTVAPEPKREVAPRPPPKVEVQKQLHPYVRVALFDDDGSQIKDPGSLDWPEMKMLHLLTKKMYLGCCCADECNFEEHKHELDDTALGLARPLSVATTNNNLHRCAMPVDAFDESQFPLFKFLPEAFADNLQQQRQSMRQLNNNSLRMTHRNAAADMRYGGLMMRLRAQYFVELANVRASYAQSRTEIDTRYEPKLIIAQVSEDDDYAEEMKQARERERETVRNVFHARIDTLHTHMQTLVVRTLVQCSTMTEFRLTMPMTTKACLDAIRLPGGAEQDDQLYSDLFVDIAKGQLDELEHQKRLLSNSHNLSLDAYYSEFVESAGPGDHLKSSRTFNDTVRNASSTTMNEDFYDNDDEQYEEADSDTELAAFIGESPPAPDYPTPPLHPPPLQSANEEQQKQPDSQKKRRRDEEINNEHGESANLRRVAYPCASQFAIEDARTACTAIAFVVAMRLVSAHLLNTSDLLGTTEAIFTQLDYPQIIDKGAKIWQTWCARRHLKILDARDRLVECETTKMMLQTGGMPASEELDKKLYTLQLTMRDFQSTFMHAAEVVESSEFVRATLDKFGLVTYESAGFWNGNPSAIGDDDAPSLANALAAAEKLGIFASVLTIGGSSVCVAYTDDRWFLFDSHGVDRPGFSTLVSFAQKERVLQLICSSLDAVSDLAGYDEFDRMRLGTYSLYVMHYKPADPEKD